MTQILRRCVDCGLEAHNEKELERFMKDARSTSGRRHLCNQCLSKRRKERRKTDDRHYLRVRFQGMKRRCYDPNDPAFSRYGGRGIIICQEWLDDPNAFINWAFVNGFQRDLQIDRIDNDGAYAPDNCRWVTPQVQARNRRDNVTNFKKGTRICSRCGEEKSLEDFYHNKKEPAGRDYTCKICAAEIYRAQKA